MMITDQELQSLRILSTEELKVELGRAIFKERGGLQAPSIKKLITEANTWLASKNDELKFAICSNDKVRQIAESEAGATEKLVRVVADVASATTILMPAGTVAEILVRDGIPKYCQTIWNPPS